MSAQACSAPGYAESQGCHTCGWTVWTPTIYQSPITQIVNFLTC
jgi:hypothetical protein